MIFPYSRLLVPLAVLAGLLAVALVSSLPPSLPEIEAGSPRGGAALQSAWARGEAVVLARHAERCDRSAAACLGPADGITVRGRDLAAATGKAFERLGGPGADVLASPATRTQQTAQAMFGRPVATREWLANCGTVTAEDLLRRKAAGRNLVLVTHSHCIRKFGRDIGAPSARNPAYGSLLFIAVDEGSRAPVAAGLVGAVRFIAGFHAAK